MLPLPPPPFFFLKHIQKTNNVWTSHTRVRGDLKCWDGHVRTTRRSLCASLDFVPLCCRPPFFLPHIITNKKTVAAASTSFRVFISLFLQCARAHTHKTRVHCILVLSQVFMAHKGHPTFFSLPSTNWKKKKPTRNLTLVYISSICFPFSPSLKPTFVGSHYAHL